MGDRQDDEDLARESGLTAGLVCELRTARGLRDEALRRMPQAALRRALRRLDLPDFPRARDAFARLQQVDEHGARPEQALATAVNQLDSTRSRRPHSLRVAGLPSGPHVTPRSLIAFPMPRAAGLEPGGGGWRSLGPGNIGGRTRSLVVHPEHPERLWAGSAGGGVWHSRNGGESWEPVDDFMANLAVSCLAIDPTDPRVIYAGTGEGFSNVDALRGEGVFRTTDAVSWQLLPATAIPELRWINRLAVSADGRVLLAATPEGIWRSEDPDRLSFERVLARSIADVDFHPGDPRQAIAGSLRGGNAFYSIDGGASWQRAEPSGVWSGRVELTYAACDPHIVYASVDTHHGQVWRSRNGGRSYEPRASLTVEDRPAHYLGDQGWYGNAIWAGDPTDADLVVVGGIDLWRSRDGGETLTDISTWWETTSAHADHHAIVAHPRYDGRGNRTVFFGNDGGVYRADDVTSVGDDPEPPRLRGWRELVNTYGVTQFWGGAGNPTTGVIIGGAQDRGTVCFSPAAGPEGWTTMMAGDGGFCAADPSDPNVFYGEYVFLAVHRSTDGGQTSEFICGQHWDETQWIWKPIPYRIPDAMSNQALFIAPFVLDPNQPDRLLAGGVSLWRCDDAKAPNTPTRGPSWRAIKRGVGAPISAIAVAQGNSNLVWVGHSDGQVYKTHEGAAATPLWHAVDRHGPQALVPRRYCTRIAIHPQLHDVVFVAFGGYLRGNLWQTLDGGRSWRNLGSALPAAPVRSLAIHPRRLNYVYAGTEVGIFASEDGGTSWAATNEGPTNCAVNDMFWMGETLVCATHGRGMFAIDLSRV